MRIKETRLVVTFHTTTDAMAMEAAGKETGLKGRLIPVPRAVTAGCGLAWSEPAGGREALELLICERHLAFDRIIEMVI